MNKVLGITAIICAVLIVIGVGILFIGKALGGTDNFSFEVINNKLTSSTKEMVENTVDVETFDSLNVDVDSAKLVIKKGDANQVYYKIDKKLEPTITNENGTLTVSSKYPENGTFFTMNIGDNEEYQNYIEIRVKDADFLNLVVKSDSGSIEVSDIAIEGNIESSSGSTKITDCAGSGIVVIDSDSGSTTITDADFDSLKIQKDSGSIKLINVNAEEVSLDSSSGSQTLDSCDITKFGTKRDSGSLKVDGSTIDEVNAEASSGSTNYNECVIGNFTSSTDSGSTTLYIQGKESDYNYKFDITSGSVKINDEKKSNDYEKDNGADKTIDIQADSGSTRIDFYE